jgi:hypothetical protein
MTTKKVSVYEPELRKAVAETQKVAVALPALLTPVAVAAYSLALWRLGADLGLTGEFFVSRGLFSHWQVWLALGLGTHLTSTMARRSSGGSGLIAQ